MTKKAKDRIERVKKALEKQKIRSIKDLESYKLSVCHPCSAGIDIGSREIYVGINPEIATELGVPIVHTFSTYTSGLKECVELLLYCGITDVAMESTSVYWKNLYDALERAGISPCLVNPKKFRMVPGRKTDVLDCQWLQTLHMYGLMSGSFIPDSRIRALRSYMRERDNLLKDRNRYIQRMQKAMVEMNLMLVNAVSDITGKTGTAIIEAILFGERDPHRLSALRDGRTKKGVEEIALSLEGDYKDEQLYLLQSNYDTYKFLNGQIERLDSKIEELLETFPPKTDTSRKPETVNLPKGGKPQGRRKGKNDLKTKSDLGVRLEAICGVNLSSITGLQSNTILQVISEVGIDMSRFPSAKCFASYLGFTPHNKITGEVIISSRTDRIKSHAAQAFKKVVPSISQGKTALAAFYHRIAAKAGTGKAIVAVCRKLAICYWNVLTKGTDFIELGQENYRIRQQQKEKALLAKLARKHQFCLVPDPQ